MKTLKDIKSPFKTVMETKTDLERKKLEAIQEYIDMTFVTKKDLKLEAINRAKIYLSQMSFFEVYQINTNGEAVWSETHEKKCDDEDELKGRVDELIEFYNLTMEDLRWDTE